MELEEIALFRIEFFDEDGDMLKKIIYFATLSAVNDYIRFHLEDVELISIDEFDRTNCIDIWTDDWSGEGIRVVRI